MEQQRAGKKYVRYNKVIEVLLHCTIAEMKNIVPRTYYNYRGLLYRGSTIMCNCFFSSISDAHHSLQSGQSFNKQRT